MSRLASLLKTHWALATLVTISVLICFLNYTPGTFLSGWDTLHPEFDFGLNLKRTLFGVFRMEQGLGAVAAHAHMAELPRILALYLLHFFLPINFIRYAYVFLCLIIGPLGMYFFLLEEFKNKQSLGSGDPQNSKFRIASEKLLIPNSKFLIQGPAFLGALFYLLNLGTLQTFNVPFEMFTTLYATLPFIFLIATNYIRKDKSSDYIKHTSYGSSSIKSEALIPKQKFLKFRNYRLLLFSIVILLTAPAAYASTLWFVFFACFFTYFFVFSILTKNKKTALRRFLNLNLIILVLNSFWLLPNLYFLFTQAGNVRNAAINQLFSEEAFLKNREFATLPDFLLLKSFYFDWTVWNGTKFVGLLDPFIKYLNSILGVIASFLVALSVVTGGTYYIYKERRHALPLISLFLISAFFLAPGPLFNLISNISPIFKEAFRFPQDKVLNIGIFVFSIFFAYSALLVSKFLKHLNIEKLLKRSPALFNKLRLLKMNKVLFAHSAQIGNFKLEIVIFSLLLVLFMLPVFTGNLINKQMRVALPSSYFDLFSYLKSEPGPPRLPSRLGRSEVDGEAGQAKVAPLPSASPWGWVYYDWGKPSFQGAGFLYFGIDKPLLDRDFDRWSPYNEEYYREMSQAIYSKDAPRLKIVIKKYNIGYLILDTSVISPGVSIKSLFLPETKDLLEKLRSEKVLSRKQFGHNLFVYKTRKTSNKTLETINKITPVAPSTNSYSNDLVYSYLGNYFSKPGARLFPARSLLKNTFETVGLNVKKDKIVINLPKMNYSMIVKDFVSKRLTTSLVVEKSGISSILTFYPDLFYLNDNPIGTPFTTEIDSNSTLMSVNDSVYSLENITLNTPTSLGKAYLSGKNNKVELYNDQVERDSNSTLNPFVVPCDSNNLSKISSVTSFISGNTMRIENSTNDKICLRLSLSDFITSPGLGKISFDYEGTSKINTCLKAATEGDCINTPLVAESNYNKTFFFKVNASDLASVDFVIELDPQNSKADDLITFTEFGLIRPAGSTSFDLSPLGENPGQLPDIFSSFESEHPSEAPRIGAKENEAVWPPKSKNEISIPINITTDTYYDITREKRLDNDCQNVPFEGGKTVITAGGTREIRYESALGGFCDHFSYPRLAHFEPYLLVLETKNEIGLSLSVCVSSPSTHRCALNFKAKKSPEYQKQVFLLPALGNDGFGYDLNIENLGIKGARSVNYLKSATFIPFPYDELQRLYGFEAKTENSAIGFEGDLNTQTHFPGKIISEREIFPGFIEFKTDGKPTFINLPYSFEKGFILLNTKYGILNTHAVTNGWSNGWILPDGKTRPQTYFLVYWPQYLEFAGLTLLFLYFLYIISSLFSFANFFELLRMSRVNARKGERRSPVPSVNEARFESLRKTWSRAFASFLGRKED